MRWLLTFTLMLLVGAGLAWLLVEDRIRTAIGWPKPTLDSGSQTLGRLEVLRVDDLHELRVSPPEAAPLVLTRSPNGEWSQPGNWPLRDAEVATLLNTLTTLRTRFDAIPLNGEKPELASYGLDQPATRVEVLAELKTVRGPETLRLTFGQPAGSNSAFDRPCYLRIDTLPEVIRLGPDVFPLLARSPEIYRRRQLLPAVDRVKFSGDASPTATAAVREPLLGDQYQSVTVERTGENPLRYSLTRLAPTPEPKRDPNQSTSEPTLAPAALAQVWRLDFSTGAKPPVASVSISDRIDPAKLKTILTTIPDLWVESFIPAGKVTLAAAGLETPDRTLTIQRADGQSLVLLIGKEIRSTTKTEPAPPPPQFGMPPPPPKVTTETYNYAKLKDNELLFELRTDKLNAVFSEPQELRDAQLARYQPGDVVAMTITPKGQPPITLTRKRGNKNASKDEEKQDRWYVGDILADAAKVNELLEPLSKLEAKGTENIQDAVSTDKLKAMQLAEPNLRVGVTLQTEVALGEPTPAAKILLYDIGLDDVANKKLPVRVSGWDRVNLVDDGIVQQLTRPAMAYRSRRLYDTTELRLETLTVKAGSETRLLLSETRKPTPEAGTVWTITEPIKTPADESKASQLATSFSTLEVQEYVDENPKPDDLEKKYGLAKPRFLVEATFSGPNAKPARLEIGNLRPNSTDVFARIPGSSSIFLVKKEFVDSLESGATGLLPTQFWSVASDKITAVEVNRLPAKESYQLVRAGMDWKVSGPITATANFTEIQPLLGAVATLQAEKFDALKMDPARHGLDQPQLKLRVTYREEKPGPMGQPPLEITTTRTVLIGKPTEPGAVTRYARLEGDPNPAVFVLADGLLKEADKPALDRLDKVLLSVDATRISKVQIVGPTAEQNLTLVKDEKSSSWKAEGVSFPIDLQTLDGLLFGSARPPIQRLVAYGDAIKWADYGLEKPTHTITLTVAGDKPTTHTISLGKTQPNGERYIRVADKQAVGVLPGRIADLLARGKLDFVDRNLMSFDPETVRSLVRKQGKTELQLSKAGLNWELTKPAKHKADQSGVSNLLDELGSLRASKVAAFAPLASDLDGKYGLKNPTATVEIKLADSKTRLLKIGKPVDASKPDAERFISVEGENAAIVGTLNSQLVRKLLAEPLKFRDRFVAKFVDVDKITMTRGERTISFGKVNGSWKVTAPLMADAEQGGLDELINALGSLNFDELVAEKPADLKPFGLAAPEVKWSLAYGDRPVMTLLVGSIDKGTNRAFAKLETGEMVGLLDPALSNRVTGEYRKRTVFTDLDAAQIEGLTISGAFNMALQKSPSGQWTDASKPNDVINANAVTDVLAVLGNLKLERYVADEKAKLGLYGLEKPSQVLVITVKGQPARMLQIGNKVGGTNGKQVYARLPEQQAVFILSEADTAKLLQDRTAYLGKK